MVADPDAWTISVVVPVYRGEATLEPLVDEVVTTSSASTELPWRITEVVLVHDAGPDRSDLAMQRLAKRYPTVKNVWLSRNFGQHAATIAGIESTTGSWVVTLDEDGQFNPADIGRLVSAAAESGAHVVYARPVNDAPHGFLRNLASRLAKRMTRMFVGSSGFPEFYSFRLINGSLARSMAARVGPGVYLDIALSWATDRYASAEATFRGETRRSAYTPRRLVAHFLRLMVSSGTGVLRGVGLLGVVTGLIGIVVALVVLAQKLTQGIDAPGWTSLMIVVLVTSGAILGAIGVVAEYLGVVVGTTMGRPLYLAIDKPTEPGPPHTRSA